MTSRSIGQFLPSRRASLALTGTVALVAATVTFASGVQQSRADNMPASSASVAMLTPKATAFHDAMRELWEYHGTYTERAIVDYIVGNPDTNAVIATLRPATPLPPRRPRPRSTPTATRSPASCTRPIPATGRWVRCRP